MSGHGVIKRYRDFLPVSEDTQIISLNEGGTPLIDANQIVKEMGADFRLLVKHEGLNPTASFKDRGMTLAVTKAVERGARFIVCASTGNTSASAAAYAAAAGLTCLVLLPEGKIASGKMAQALIHGAQTIEVSGNFDDALKIVRELGERDEFEVVNSINPFRIEGQKTAAFEICDVLARAPDMHFLPVGNAGNITAYWRGYKEYYRSGIIAKPPRMIGWQAEGAAPIVKGSPVESPETIATAIRIGNPASWDKANEAVEESEGSIGMVSDDEILDAHRLLAREAGIFVEPASAAGIAGLLKHHEQTAIPSGSTVVVTVTGHGLKDPEVAVVNSRTESTLVSPDLNSVLAAIGLD
ncbi:MAG: threonine synthase [Candidatus Thermoplasmatota archaeon]|nr:threonine synthase [Candidatus Thermoplasmatota archaeon]